MGLPRFFAPQADAAGATIDLPEDEASHLTRVLRLRAGDRVRVFDGRGHEWTATVQQTNKQIVRVTLDESVGPVPEPRIFVTLAVAVLKADKMDDIVRDAVMLGVGAIQPMFTARTEVSPTSVTRSGRVGRWQRIAVSSAKQCGRAVIPTVREVVDFAAVCGTRDPAVMLVEPGASASVVSLRELPLVDRATVLTGPEGGWTSEELALASESGATLLTFRGQTLRADAIPIVALTALRVHWEDF